MHEADVIRLAQSARLRPELLLGIGDDAAILQPPAGKLVWTVDTLVENTHFLRAMPADAVGWKSLAVNLSDLAAMHAEPLAALLSLSLPPNLPESWTQDFFRGFHAACAHYRVDLAGGDTVRSQELQISVSLLGSSDRPIDRFGARAGDVLVVTGCFGGAAAGLACWQRGLQAPGLLERHLRPRPRLAEARLLAQVASRLAMLDTSDGLARSLQLLCQANRLGCEIDGERIPIQPELADWADSHQQRQWVLDGGEDYELLAALPAEAAAQLADDPRFSVIGRLTSAPCQQIIFADQQLSLEGQNWGFQHF